jgi:hypothetical protein
MISKIFKEEVKKEKVSAGEDNGLRIQPRSESSPHSAELVLLSPESCKQLAFL